MSLGPAPEFTLSESRPWYRRNLVVLAIIVVTILIVIGMWQCGRGVAGLVRQGTGPSLRATEQFHAQLNRGAYDEIYTGATEEFRKSGSQQELTTFFEAVHRKLGDFVSSGSPSYFVQATTNGMFVTLTYQSTFQRGKGAERFVWKIEGGQPRLMGYNIDSRELITN